MRLNTNQQGTAMPCARGPRPVLPMRGRNPRLNICLAFCLLHACGPFCPACTALVLCTLHTSPVCFMQCIRFHLAFTASIVGVPGLALVDLSRWLSGACNHRGVVLSVVHGVNIRQAVV